MTKQPRSDGPLESQSLRHLHTFGIEVEAKYFTNVQTREDLLKALEIEHQPKLILGGGSNIVFTHNFEGLIIRIATKGIRITKENENHVWVQVEAGEDWHHFVLWCIEHDYGGVENLSLIPGTVGAAPIQNIGAYGVELESVFDQLHAIDRRRRRACILRKSDCKFGYRDSIFKQEAKDRYCITSVTFCLTKHKHKLKLDYGAIRQVLAEKSIHQPSIKDVSDAVIQIRKSKLPDPNVVGNAGSFFKNPIVPDALYKLWREKHPNIPGYPTPEGTKVPAGWIIDQLGWRGKSHGGASVFENHALVLINKNNATGADLITLVKKINQSVYASFGIHLEQEVNLIGMNR